MTQCINGIVSAGDMVLSGGYEDFSYLVGYVQDISPIGSPGHDPDHIYDDVMVNFSDAGYSSNREHEIESDMRILYGRWVAFSDLPLSGVIMPPDNLIRITGICQEEMERILASKSNAKRLFHAVERLQREPILQSA